MKKRSFYRPEIDGLRALAIIPVVLFHAGVAGFGGGFVGVDVFFVISGFLITSIILREIKLGKFSLVTFWERRVRRIMPVMFFVMAAVLVAAYFIILFPIDFADYGQSLAAQALFLANIFFMRKSSYFAGPSESMPLLHMWSLSVEEQFYIGFPILLLGVAYFAKGMYRKVIVFILALVFALSFIYNLYLIEFFPGGGFTTPFVSNIWGAATNANAGFFFLPARAWELTLGALLATGIFSLKNKWSAEVLSSIGLVGIIYAVVTFGDTTPFPGYAALIPTMGSALIILANTNFSTLVGQFLSFPVFIWIGLISYSLYLWQWPVIVFSKILFDDAERYVLPLLILMFLLSWFTYRYVETPFRERRLCPKSYQMFLFGFFAITILVTAGLTINKYDGFGGRASEASRSIAVASVDGNPRERECFLKSFSELFSDGTSCILGDQSDTDNIDFVFWGDSHGDATMPVIDTMAKERGLTGAFFGAGGCGPIIWETELVKDARCLAVKEQAVKFIRENNIEKVLLIASWETSQKKLAGNNDFALVGNKTEVIEEPIDTAESFLSAFRETIHIISTESSDIYVMKRVPILAYNIRKEFNKAARTNRPVEPIYQRYSDYFENNKDQNAAIDTLVSEGTITAIDPSVIFCPDDLCSIMIDGNIVYKNSTHINTTGAMYLRPLFEDFFQSMTENSPKNPNVQNATTNL